MSFIASRRKFVHGPVAGGTVLSLKYSPTHAAGVQNPGWHGFEDLYRNTWTRDPVARGTHGMNGAGAGLIKPTGMDRDLGHQPPAFAPNQTCKDLTCNFEKADRNAKVRVSA